MTNSTVLEAQLMSHDAGVTATELYTHLHMLQRCTVLVDLPQCDKDHLLVISVGGSDLFGPSARKVKEWKKDTEEEKMKFISLVIDEPEIRDKAAKKKSSSSARPPRSLSYQSPRDALPTPRSKDSYHRPPGQSFRRDSQKQSCFKSRQSSSSKEQFSAKNKKPSSQQHYCSNGGGQGGGQGPARKDRDNKGSQQSRSLNKKWRGGGGNQRK